jgi:hypothetical protein
MASFFDRLLGHRAETDAPHRAAESPDLAAAFAHPEGTARWTVLLDNDPWRIVDDRGVTRLLCDKRTTVRTTGGAALLRLAPDLAATIGPSVIEGVALGVVGDLTGTGYDVSNSASSTRRPNPMAQPPRLVRDATAGLVIAKVVDAADGSHIELLPPGMINDRVIARRLSPELATQIRALGPLKYRITDGDPTNGAGELSGPSGHAVATDEFTYLSPVRRSGTVRCGLAGWAIEIINNPFPASWLLALLRATKTTAG